MLAYSHSIPAVVAGDTEVLADAVQTIRQACVEAAQIRPDPQTPALEDTRKIVRMTSADFHVCYASVTDTLFEHIEQDLTLLTTALLDDDDETPLESLSPRTPDESASPCRSP